MGKERGNYRYLILFSVIAVTMLLVVIRYIVLMTTPFPQGQEAHVDSIERGAIEDRNGKILAMQTELYNLNAWKPNIVDIPTTAKLIAEAIGEDEATILAKLGPEGANFIYIKKRLGVTDRDKLSRLISSKAITGVWLEAVSVRSYPEKTVASHLLGYVDIDGNGVAGIEKSYDAELKPEASSGKRTGNQVFLTIDLRVQYELEALADKAYSDYKAEAVMFLAMDPRNGEILGYVSRPNFDPNHFGDFPMVNLYDKPALFNYEPGSVFKVITIASLLQMGGITDKSTFFCDGFYHKEVASGENIKIKCNAAHGWVTPQLILEYSCNSGIGQASDTVTNSQFYDALRAFGFGQRTGIPLPGESPGSLRPAKDWSARTKPTVAFGQEISVSALQMMYAYTAIGNGGILMKPQVVKRVVSPDGKLLYEMQAEPTQAVVSREVATQTLSFMETSTASVGKNTQAEGQDIRISAKTGTAQIIDPKTGKYSEDDYTASCIAVLPTDNPKLILYLVIYKPRGVSYYGNKIAAPLVREAAEKLALILGIGKSDDVRIVHPGQIQVESQELLSIGDQMPDLIGKPKKLLLSLLSRKDLRILIQGEGYVVSQSPVAGNAVKPGDTITLELK